MKKIENRAGETQLNNFGSTMIITVYRKYKDIDVHFPEYNWTAEHTNYDLFKKGSIVCPYEPRTCGMGYLGVGKYKTREKGKQTKEYNAWCAMLTRCYSPRYQEKEPTYIGCTVCNEWLNFQVFAEWYEENYYEIPNQCTAIDKDILVKGNKVYSPSTCVFVPQNINSLFTKRDNDRGELPIGVTYHKKKYRARCNTGTGVKFLGYYDDPIEAFLVYKQFKEAFIKKVANDYIEDIPFELYLAMLDYEVEMDD